MRKKRRNWKHSREFNANSHVVGKTNMRCDIFCHVPPQYWLSISGKIVRASNQQKLSHFCVLFCCVWKIDYVTKKSFCVLFPLFPCSSFLLIHLPWTSKFVDSANFIELQKNILCKKMEGKYNKNMAKDISRNLILLLYCHANATVMKKKFYFSWNF